MNQRYDLLAFSLLAFSVVVSAFLGLVGPLYGPPKLTLYDLIKEWQVLFSVAATFAAASFAWRGAMKKLRMDVIAREEERIEDVLPELEDARDILEEWLNALISVEPRESQRVVDGLFVSYNEEWENYLKKRMPSATDVLRKKVELHLEFIQGQAALIKETENLAFNLKTREPYDRSTLSPDSREEMERDEADVNKRLVFEEEKLLGYLTTLQRRVSDLHERCDTYSKRRKICRQEIEAFFSLENNARVLPLISKKLATAEELQEKLLTQLKLHACHEIKVLKVLSTNRRPPEATWKAIPDLKKVTNNDTLRTYYMTIELMRREYDLQ